MSNAPPSLAPILAMEGLSKSFGALRVTDNVTLRIAPGECHAVIGPNGAGKTTLIHQISGHSAPDAGRVLLGGHDITRLAMPARARAGLVRSFQITSILPEFTARENVALAVQAMTGTSFRFFGRAAAEGMLNERAEAALAVVGMSGRAHVPAGLLSHGEKRQLEIAIALALEPKVLLLDEPMAGAGPEETRQLVETLKGLKQRFTILLVEHDMHAVFALADRISVLVAGSVIATGAPDAIRNDPAVKLAYLGEPGVAA